MPDGGGPEVKVDAIYTAAQVRRAMAACGSDSHGVRNAALINLLWCSGLRCAEGLNLSLQDVDRSRGTVWVALGKGGLSRLVVLPRPMLSELWRRIDEWLPRRPSAATPLFCSSRGRVLDASYVRRLFRELGDTLGFQERFHPHGLRHTFASRMHVAGVRLQVIQQQLGHSDVSVTGTYLRHLDAKLAQQAVSQARV